MHSKKASQGIGTVCLFVIVAGISLLPGCSTSRHGMAPVSEVATVESVPRSGVHYVRREETLYAIAWRYGMDYRELAAINHIEPPWRVWVGEPILLRPRARATHPTARMASVRSAKPTKADHRVSYVSVPPQGDWVWPAKGNLASVYSSSNRGVNIAGRLGDPVFATAPGTVVYAGDGLRGYGNLIIIKHNNALLSAYAWNRSLSVHQGDQVRAGQRIATVGYIGRQRPMLHFEIRQNGRSVNPLQYLRHKSPV
jgi:lipoprotein NlpD